MIELMISPDLILNSFIHLNYFNLEDKCHYAYFFICLHYNGPLVCSTNIKKELAFVFFLLLHPFYMFDSETHQRLLCWLSAFF